jgi:pyridoxamine 5'-phosphate oxidase
MALEHWMVQQVKDWLAQAAEQGEPEANAMAVATVDATGNPALRTVLMKDIDQDGPQFFTNYQSDKAEQITGNPEVAASLVFKVPYRQIIFRGPADRLPGTESDAYWATRDRDSQLGGWASQQSRSLDTMETLVKRVEDFRQRFEGQDVPRPPHWGGYHIRVREIEFWDGKAHRLHDRVRYSIDDQGQWQARRLFP